MFLRTKGYYYLNCLKWYNVHFVRVYDFKDQVHLFSSENYG